MENAKSIDRGLRFLFSPPGRGPNMRLPTADDCRTAYHTIWGEDVTKKNYILRERVKILQKSGSIVLYQYEIHIIIIKGIVKQ
eukprot:scaffold34674_cov171-Amphora_coffeaeformis.AAC.2